MKQTDTFLCTGNKKSGLYINIQMENFVIILDAEMENLFS